MGAIVRVLCTGSHPLASPDSLNRRHDAVYSWSALIGGLSYREAG